jgi:hypothetical protein
MSNQAEPNAPFNNAGVWHEPPLPWSQSTYLKALEWSKSIRPLLGPFQFPMIFHGTRYPTQVLMMEGRLVFPPVGLCAIHFTRELVVASYYALLERQGDEGNGAVLAFDQTSMAQYYQLHFANEQSWLRDPPEEPNYPTHWHHADVSIHRQGTLTTAVPAHSGRRPEVVHDTHRGVAVQDRSRHALTPGHMRDAGVRR